jgi:sulfate permease, SulP family
MPDTKSIKKASFSQIIREEIQPKFMVSSILAGVIIGILTIIVEISFAALIFSGDLSPFIGRGIGLMLFGAFSIGLVVALTSSFPGTVARPHEIPAAILALAVGSIAGSLQSSGNEEMFLTVLAAVVFTSLLTGIFFLVLGYFKLGSLIRFVPYPVVGGFLAGTGWLLIKGGVGVMTDKKVSLANTALFFQPDILMKWVPGFLFAIILVMVLKKWKHFLVMPTMLFAGMAVFYGIMFATGTSMEQVKSAGWLLGPFQQGGLWQPLPITEISHVAWPLIFAQASKIATILFISVLPLLLNANGLELVVKSDIDFNRELKSAGWANIFAGLGGGTVGIHSLSLSALAFRIGARGRLIGIIAALVCGAALFLGPSALSVLPRPLLGGLLFYLGLCFLIEWVIESYPKLPKVDYLLVILILLIIGAAGFLQGVVVGILIAVVLFVINYSRVRVVKYILSGAHFHSNVDRASDQRTVLREKGERVHILKLQGYVFFGTANILLNQVRQRAEDSNQQALQFVIFDFSLVTGLDSSALRSFAKMQQLAEKHQFTFVFTALSSELQQQFEKGMEKENAIAFHMFPDLDHGVEWCEDELLKVEKACNTCGEHTLINELTEAFHSATVAAAFIKHLIRKEAQTGNYLMRQGDPPQVLYFIESGQVTALLELQDGKTARLRTMGTGTVVGEIGMFMGTKATASVVVTQPAVVYSLSQDALVSMEEKEPEVAAAFHKFIIRLLGERLARTNKSLKILLE